MSYIVYTGVNCHDCHLVVDFIKENKLDVAVCNVDTDDVETPLHVYARPALFVDGDVKAYGIDIIDYLKRHLGV